MPHNSPNALGIDVDHDDGPVDWPAVLSTGGRAFAFVKATEGITVTDDRFEANWVRLAEVGMARGAYHFFRSNDDPDAQAAHFLATVSRLPTDLPPSLDLETADGVGAAVRIERARRWLELVEAQIGQKPFIYTSPNFWRTQMGDTHEFSRAGYPLWIARYTLAPTPQPLPGGWDEYAFWQYAPTQETQAPHYVHVPGVQNAVDADVYNGTHEEMIQRFGLRA